MATISQSKLEIIKRLYYTKRYSMRSISERLDVSIDCVTYFMRKNNLVRRTFKEEQKMRFDKKIPSFEIRRNNKNTEELKVIGSMLYWGEGYKGDNENPAKLIDFANSDPDMILLFLKFLRNNYKLQENKFRILLYCYSNQDVDNLVDFWSKLINVPKNQFTKPYIKDNFKVNGRKMKYGLIHVRYYDKKLLLEIKKMIDSYKIKYIR